MAYRKKYPLRALSDDEQAMLVKVARSASDRAERVRRAKALLSVADGKSYTAAAKDAGIGCFDTVSILVGRFNKCGLAALDSSHGGGPAKKYGQAEKDRILMEVKRKPDPEKDGGATWSLTLLQKSLRSAQDGLPEVSTYTILQTLHEAGYSWQESRTWCSTGSAQRKRGGKVVTVTDPECEEKRGD
jgi:transposase